MMDEEQMVFSLRSCGLHVLGIDICDAAHVGVGQNGTHLASRLVELFLVERMEHL